MTRILALDPSTKKIGWCLYDADNDTVMYWGDWTVQGDGLDMRLHYAARWLDRLSFDLAPLTEPLDCFAIEMPVVHRNIKTTIILAQMVGALRREAYPWTERTIEVLPSERLSALGLPIKLKRLEAKQQVRRLVNAIYGLDLQAKDHDAADAIAIARAAAGKLKREWDV